MPGQLTRQNVWSPVYVDALIAQDTDSDGDGVIDGRVYVLQDANWNVTALLDTSGDVIERFTYDAYGKRSALTSNWFPTTDPGFQYGHQGGRIDAVTGRINFRNRDYDVDLMRWVQQDYKAGYVDGLNLYAYVSDSPTRWIDPAGEAEFADTRGEAVWNPYTRHFIGPDADRFNSRLSNPLHGLGDLAYELKQASGFKNNDEIDRIIEALGKARDRLKAIGPPSVFKFNGCICTQCEGAVANQLNPLFGAKSNYSYTGVYHYGWQIDWIPFLGHLGLGDHAWGELTDKTTGQIYTIDFWYGGFNDFWRKGQNAFGVTPNKP